MAYVTKSLPLPDSPIYRALKTALNFTTLASITEHSLWLIASVSTQTLNVLHVVHSHAASLCSSRCYLV